MGWEFNVLLRRLRATMVTTFFLCIIYQFLVSFFFFKLIKKWENFFKLQFVKIEFSMAWQLIVELVEFFYFSLPLHDSRVNVASLDSYCLWQINNFISFQQQTKKELKVFTLSKLDFPWSSPIRAWWDDLGDRHRASLLVDSRTKFLELKFSNKNHLFPSLERINDEPYLS